MQPKCQLDYLFMHNLILSSPSSLEKDVIVLMGNGVLWGRHLIVTMLKNSDNSF